MSWHEIEGRVHYRGQWMVLLVDNGIAEFYRSLIPPCHRVNGPRHMAHVTIVPAIEKATGKAAWGKRRGLVVPVVYSTEIVHDDTYWWLPVQGTALSRLRAELGLDYCHDKRKGFHITVANMKGA